MVDDGGENFAFWFSKTREIAFQDAFSNNFVIVPQSRNIDGPWHTRPPRLRGPW